MKKPRANLGVRRDLLSLASAIHELATGPLAGAGLGTKESRLLRSVEKSVLEQFPWASLDALARARRQTAIFFATWDLSQLIKSCANPWLRQHRKPSVGSALRREQLANLLARQIRPTLMQDRLFDIAALVLTINESAVHAPRNQRPTVDAILKQGAIVRKLNDLLRQASTADLLLEPTDYGYGPVVAAREILATLSQLSVSTLKAASRHVVQRAGA